MKVIIKTYVDHASLSWKIANIFTKLTRGDEDKTYDYMDVVAKVPGYEFCQRINMKYGDWLESRRVSVKIDKWDTYSMDATLTYIILPMLKQMRQELHGAPHIDYKDTDESLWPTEEDLKRAKAEPGWTDENFFKRWENVIDQMIEAFEIHSDDDVMYPQGEDRVKLENGLRLFGKYYINLWT